MITVALSRDLAPFEGPLDLLLALVRRNQYPLDALPIAEITRQYDAYLREAADADMELGGDFIETASWLVLLKSRAMLPQVAGEEPPARELERALLDHESWKATASLLRSRMEGAGLGPGDASGEPPAIPDESLAAPPTLHDALAAARRALALAKAHSLAHVYAARMLDGESASVAAILRLLEERLQALEPGRGISTEKWFEELAAPEAQVTLLLALLELARLQRILLGQREECGALLLKRVVL